MSATAPAMVLNGIQKCAVVLISLGDAASADLLKLLSEDEVQKVTEALAHLPPISEEQAAAVLREFHAVLGNSSGWHQGGLGFAKRILTTAFGPEGSRKHLDRLPQGSGGEQAKLRRLDPALLARFVEAEHPQTVAMVLAHLGAAQSAAVLRAMKPEQRTEVMLRLARLDQIAPAVMEKVSSVISKKLQKFGELKRESSGGVRAVAEIFKQLDAELSEEILERLNEADSPLVESIRQNMFVFEDLHSLDASGVKELLARADRRVLTVALKGASEELRKHLLQGMSQRGSAMLLEDMEALGPVKIRDVEAAQQQVISAARQLESEGIVSLKGGGGDDQYIV
jgi:flagellar motor switch protein FliG